jgi:hypothetical protein
MKLQELFKDESTWTRYAFARDKDGKRLSLLDTDEAVCFCLDGGLSVCYENKFDQYGKIAKYAREKFGYYPGIWHLNDALLTFKSLREMIEALDL